MQDLVIATPQAQGTLGRFVIQNVATAPVIAVEVVVDSVGATPTITYFIQGLSVGGSVGVGSDWNNLNIVVPDSSVAATSAGFTVSSTGRRIYYIDGLDKRFFPAIALNVTANTNVAYHANAYIAR